MVWSSNYGSDVEAVGSKKRKKRVGKDAGNTGAPPLPQSTFSPQRVPRRRRATPLTWWIWPLVVFGLLLGGGLYIKARGYLAERASRPPAPQVRIDAGAEAESFAQIQSQRLIRDVHEHIESLEYAPIYIDIMDELGIKSVCLMGSSKFTLTLNEKYGFTQYDENNEELVKIVKAYPGRFEAWVTVNPVDGYKLDKVKDLVARGATGVKLYIGHGYITKNGKYIFHPVAMDDPGMLPLYAYCQENYIPMCIHVNPFKGKPGFAEEFVAVLTQFPDLKIDCPHFMLSSIQSSRLRELLNTFPNLYTDVGFGDYYVAAGLKRISKSPKKFRQLFTDYPDRIMFGADLVLTQGRTKTREWVREQLTAYLDMLSKKTYTTTAIRGETLNGLALPDYLLDRVLYKNYEDFVAKRPKGTKITREINWTNMNVVPISRKPGQAFPPSKGEKGGL